jgi:hypothetical protein
MHRQFPYFFLYTVYAVITELLRFCVRNQEWTYFSVYWITEALYAVLAFFAIYEVFRSVFRNFYGIWGFRYLFPCVAGLMLFISLLRGYLLPGNELERIVGVIIFLKIAVGFLQVGIFTTFFLLVRLFKVRWRKYAFGIALGFGIAAGGNLAVFLLRSEIGTKFNHVVETAAPIVYIIAVVVWLVTFIKPQPPHPWQDGGPALDPEELITELRQYTKAVKGVLRR